MAGTKVRGKWLIWAGVIVGAITYLKWLNADIDVAVKETYAQAAGTEAPTEEVSIALYAFFWGVAALLVICGTILHASERRDAD